MERALDELADVVADSGLLTDRHSVLVLVSGGADSACAAAGLVGWLGSEDVHALHVNYGLRDDADDGEAAARWLCAALRIDLHIERVHEPLEGNVQAAARKIRYDAAERLRARTGSDWIATGHTRTDVAETVVYRLASSPGTRALLGLAPRSGRVIRPLLKLEREEVAGARRRRGAALRRRLDQRGADVRAQPDPGRAAAGACASSTRPRSGTSPRPAPSSPRRRSSSSASSSRRLPPPARTPARSRSPPTRSRRSSPACAGSRCGRSPSAPAGAPVPLGRARAAEITRLSGRPEGGTVELGGGLIASCESGFVRFLVDAPDAAPQPTDLTVPGRTRIGDWEIRAELRRGPVEPAGPGRRDARRPRRSTARMIVRTWREGDRIRPLGMSGHKTLQDLFTDAGVPRSLRRTVPVVTVGDDVAWVVGVAVSEDFRLSEDAERVALLSARVLD